MKAELFTDALQSVFQEVGVGKVTISEAPEDYTEFDLVGSLGIAGRLQGYLTLKSTLANAEKFVKLMATHLGMETEEETFGRFHKAAMGEITNQIAGRALMLLYDEGIDCSITPPTIIVGSHVSMSMPNLQQFLAKKISGSFGDFGFFIGLKNIEMGDENS